MQKYKIKIKYFGLHMEKCLKHESTATTTIRRKVYFDKNNFHVNYKKENTYHATVKTVMAVFFIVTDVKVRSFHTVR